MSISYQLNKTSMLALNKQLQVRIKALPTLKNKEAALRVEVKKARDYAAELEAHIKFKEEEVAKLMRLWNEFNPELIVIKEVHIDSKKIAGVKIPVLTGIDYQIRDFVMFNAPNWYLDGIAVLKEVSNLKIERQFYLRKMHILDRIRKKTTQKVNLYEKVQIPAYEDAILKIKRFLEDEENLSKSGQKILKKRMQEATV